MPVCVCVCVCVFVYVCEFVSQSGSVGPWVVLCVIGRYVCVVDRYVCLSMQERERERRGA